MAAYLVVETDITDPSSTSSTRPRRRLRSRRLAAATSFAAASSKIATRPRQRRALAYGWDEDGRLWLTVGLGNVNSPVVGIPASISRYVAGRRFQARTQEGTPAGIIAVDDESGASWGYSPFLQRRGAEPGDVLTLRFDLVSEEVTLSLDDESVLVDEEGLCSGSLQAHSYALERWVARRHPCDDSQEDVRCSAPSRSWRRRFNVALQRSGLGSSLMAIVTCSTSTLISTGAPVAGWSGVRSVAAVA